MYQLAQISKYLLYLFKVISELFPDDALNNLLNGVNIKTDNDRLMEVIKNIDFYYFWPL